MRLLLNILSNLSLFLSLLFTPILITSQSFPWVHHYIGTGTSTDYGASTCIDANGNIYNAGNFSSPYLTIGTNTLSKIGAYTIFLAKYNQNGNVIWAKKYGGVSNGSVRDICNDVNGNLYMVGTLSGSVSYFGNYTLTTPGGGMFLGKFDNNGDAIWIKTFYNGGFGDGGGRSISSDSQGNLYLAGSFNCAQLVLGTYTLNTLAAPPTAYNGYVAKFDGNGNCLWAQLLNGTGVHLSTITLDNNNSAYITGSFGGNTLTLGSYTLTKPSNWENVLMAKYNSNGAVLWAKSAGSNGLDEGLGVLTDQFNNVYFSGYFDTTKITFGTTTLTSFGKQDAFLTKYDSNGVLKWAKNFGGNDYDRGFSISSYSTGLFYIGECSSSVFAINSTTLNSYQYSAFVIDLDTNGNAKCAANIKRGASPFLSIASLNSQSAILSGSISDSIVIGTNSFITAGGTDPFIAKFQCIPTGLKENSDIFSIIAFPNPTSKIFHIEIPKIIHKGKISFFNSVGQEVFQESIEYGSNKLNVELLGSGLYYYKINSAGVDVYIGKLIIN